MSVKYLQEISYTHVSELHRDCSLVMDTAYYEYFLEMALYTGFRLQRIKRGKSFETKLVL